MNVTGLQLLFLAILSFTIAGILLLDVVLRIYLWLKYPDLRRSYLPPMPKELEDALKALETEPK